jgi:NADPH2:quinone reductase
MNAMTTHMRAVALTRYLPIEHPDSLMDVQIEKPTASGRDLLIKVKAISINPVDTKVRKPKDLVESAPRVLGWDVAGIVEEAGADCEWFKPGDEVYYAGSIIRAGGNSEFHLVDERIVGRKPANLTFAEAAALPLTAITAWEAFHDRLGISRDPLSNAGKSVLIIGGAGGVGSIATQLARHAGLTVIGTASRPESREWIIRHGADHVVSHYEPFLAQIEAVGIKAVDYILCLNNTDQHWKAMTEVIAPQGKICTVVENVNPLDVTLLKTKSNSFVYEYMFTRSMFQTEDMIQQHVLLNELAVLVEAGIIRTTLTETLSPINAANVRQAHAKVESGSMVGKIVVEGFE